MGKAIAEALSLSGEARLTVASVLAGSSLLGADAGEIAGLGRFGVTCTDDLARQADHFDVLIDFTSPVATRDHARLCQAHGKALVCGTTGLDGNDHDLLRQVGRHVPMVVAPNMSVGVNVLLGLLRKAALLLGEDYDVEVIEAHHRFKKDAPSGTALRLGQAVADAWGRKLEDCAVYGREGITGERSRQEIGFETIRAGDVVGDHTVLFAAPGERIEFTHKASSRLTFASGAVRAATWVRGKEPGVYDMQDVLGLTDRG